MLKKTLYVLILISLIPASGCVWLSEDRLEEQVATMNTADGIDRGEAEKLAQMYILDERLQDKLLSLKPIEMRIVKDEEGSKLKENRFIWKLVFYAKDRSEISSPLPLDKFHLWLDAQTGKIVKTEFEKVK